MKDINAIHKKDNKWYFWDETFADEYGPYQTEEEAVIKLSEYIKECLENKEAPK